jgi:hypothetical protein
MAIEGMRAFAVLRLEQLSERAEPTTPTFQFLRTAGGDVYSPRGDGGFDNWNHYRQAAVEAPLA